MKGGKTMSRNADTQGLDDYVRGQLEQHYGSEIVNNVSRTAPPTLPPRRRKSSFSFAIVMCAVVFLTGAAMFAGVLFSGAVPTGGSTSSPSVSGIIDDTSSQPASSAADDTSSQPASSAADDTSSQPASSVSDDTSSQPASSAADNTSSQPASSAANDTSSQPASSTADDTSSQPSSSAAEDTSSENVSSSAGEFSTSNGNNVENQASDSYSRIESYTLPEIPSEPYIDGNIVQDDPNNNSYTNPNDNVTTGRRARAGVGIFLMIASLCSAVALYNLYSEKENNI